MYLLPQTSWGCNTPCTDIGSQVQVGHIERHVQRAIFQSWLFPAPPCFRNPGAGAGFDAAAMNGLNLGREKCLFLGNRAYSGQHNHFARLG